MGPGREIDHRVFGNSFTRGNLLAKDNEREYAEFLRANLFENLSDPSRTSAELTILQLRDLDPDGPGTLTLSDSPRRLSERITADAPNLSEALAPSSFRSIRLAAPQLGVAPSAQPDILKRAA